MLQLCTEHHDHKSKVAKLLACLSYRCDLIYSLHGLKEADTHMVCKILYLIHTCCTDSSSWHIDDSLYSQIILSIVNRFQIG